METAGTQAAASHRGRRHFRAQWDVLRCLAMGKYIRKKHPRNGGFDGKTMETHAVSSMKQMGFSGKLTVAIPIPGKIK